MTGRVLVVGAGPVGLLLAAELARCGVPTVLVDRLAVPMTESRASQLDTRSARLLHDRGLHGLVAEATFEPRGHFAGLPLDLSSPGDPLAGNWKIPQYRTEAALTELALRHGVELIRGHEVRELEIADDHVVCGGITASHVVGCDGVGSTVRDLAGFAVESVPATKELLRADVRGLDIRDRRFERSDRGLAIAATHDGVTRVMVHALGRPAAHRARPPSFTEFAATWAEMTGEDISGGEPVWVDAFGNASGQVTRYRRGRVLLAGDAARWHMPIGGQALNTGLRDAADLGPKLAAHVLGQPRPHLLDDYHDQRHAEGARVLRDVRAQELLLLGDRGIDPVRACLTELLSLDTVRRHLAAKAGGPTEIGRY